MSTIIALHRSSNNLAILIVGLEHLRDDLRRPTTPVHGELALQTLALFGGEIFEELWQDACSCLYSTVC